MDLFNSLKEFKKSLKKGKIENKEKFNVISDSLAMHNFNTKTVKKKKFISFFFEKLNIFMCKNVNHYFLPYLLVKKTFNPNSIQNKLNLNFLDFKKILIFNEEYKDYLSNFSLKNKQVFVYKSSNLKNKISNFNWIYAFSGTRDKKVLEKILKYLLILKKIKKLNKISFKGHPYWKHEDIGKDFLKILRKNYIKYDLIKNYENIDYLNYYGVITSPSTILLESTFNNPSIKLIGIKHDKYNVSRSLFEFYKIVNKKIIWEPNINNLKKYLLKKKIKQNFTSNNLKEFFTKKI